MAGAVGWRTRPGNPAATQARRKKYNSREHRAARKHYAALVEAGQARCWRCGRLLIPGAWHVGHGDGPGGHGSIEEIMGPECARSCNIKAAARKGARIKHANRKARKAGLRVPPAAVLPPPTRPSFIRREW